MRVPVFVLLICNVMACTVTHNASTDPNERRTYQAMRVQRMPVIDGKLDDTCWQKSGLLTDFVLMNTELIADYKTEGYICYDDNGIYIAMKCHLPAGTKPTIEDGAKAKKPHDNYMFSDDIVEIMIDPGRGLMDYYQLVINAYGSTFDCLRRYGGAQLDASWNGDWEHGVQIVDRHWTVELSIPFHTLGISEATKSEWGINLCRTMWKPKSEYSSTAAMGGWHNTQDFPVIQGIDVDMSQVAFQISPGELTLVLTDTGPQAQYSIPIHNNSDTGKEIRIVSTIKGDDDQDSSESELLTLWPGQRKTMVDELLEVEPLSPGRSDAYLITAAPAIKKTTVTDADTGQTLAAAFAQRPWFLETVRIEIADPWHHDMSAEKTRTVRFEVVSQLDADQRDAGRLTVDLLDGENILVTKSFGHPSDRVAIELPVHNVPWGAYQLRAVFEHADGRELAASTAAVTVLPGGQHHIKVLNNLVSELMNTRERGLSSDREVAFMNPRDGWVYISATGNGRLSLGGEELIAVSDATEQRMRYLRSGRAELSAEGEFDNIIVRAVPELIYSTHPGQFSWEFLNTHILPHCNAIVGSDQDRNAIREWTAQGKHWLGFSTAPGHGVGGSVFLDARRYYDERLSKDAGFRLPQFQGVMVDQISSCTAAQKVEIAKMLSWIRQQDNLANKQYRPWFEGSVFGSGPDMAFMKQVLDAGWPFAWYVYIPEKDTEAQVQDVIHSTFIKNAIGCSREVPNSLRRAIAQPGYMSHLPTGHFLDVNPASDFKVHMQLQFETFANDPVFFGLYGSLWYYSPYASEEYARWGGALFRHYGIEGKTEKLTADPYVLPHITNPDFADGTDGWMITEAEAGTVRTASHIGYGLLQGRFISGSHGDNFIVTKRSNKAPNVVRQQVKNLTPGRYYSLKMLSTDYAALMAEESVKSPTMWSITIDNAEMSPIEDHRQDQTYPSHYGSRLGKFNKDHPAYLNYHFRVFKAKGTRAMLTISDWASHSQSSRSLGQEQILNFVQVEPFFYAE